MLSTLPASSRTSHRMVVLWRRLRVVRRANGQRDGFGARRHTELFENRRELVSHRRWRRTARERNFGVRVSELEILHDLPLARRKAGECELGGRLGFGSAQGGFAHAQRW